MAKVTQALDAARIFHDWAAKEGLMPEGPAAPTSSTEAELDTFSTYAPKAQEILRKRGILGVLVNDPSNEIVVLTKLTKPSKKQLASLPQHIEEISVIYEQGSPKAIGAPPPKAFSGSPWVVRQVSGLDRYACGSSISQGNCRDAGTMGCLVKNPDGILFGLSNNHVSGGCSHAFVGLPILAPGVLDVTPLGQDPFTIGHHERALDMMVGTPDNTSPTNNSDAAIFKILDGARVTSYQGTAYDTPSTVAKVISGSTVEKVGRTTGHTKGQIVGQYYGSMSIFYDMDIHMFRGRVFFDPIFVVKGVGSAFADSGDSGSLVTAIDDNGGRHAVGLVVGGMNDKSAPGGILTFILPIDTILSNLNVTLVTGHNV